MLSLAPPHPATSSQGEPVAGTSESETSFRCDSAQRIALALHFARLQRFRQRCLVARAADCDTGFDGIDVRNGERLADLLAFDAGKAVRIPSGEAGL